MISLMTHRVLSKIVGFGRANPGLRELQCAVSKPNGINTPMLFFVITVGNAGFASLLGNTV